MAKTIFMKSRIFLFAYVLSVCATGLSGCDDAAQKKAKAEQQATQNGMRTNPGNYTPAPLDTSMTPRGTPKPTANP